MQCHCKITISTFQQVHSEHCSQWFFSTISAFFIQFQLLWAHSFFCIQLLERWNVIIYETSIIKLNNKKAVDKKTKICAYNCGWLMKESNKAAQGPYQFFFIWCARNASWYAMNRWISNKKTGCEIAWSLWLFTIYAVNLFSTAIDSTSVILCDKIKIKSSEFHISSSFFHWLPMIDLNPSSQNEMAILWRREKIDSQK